MNITSNADDLIRQLKGYKRQLKERETNLVSAIVTSGQEIANRELDGATYTGTLSARIEADSKGKRGYVALVGYQAGFIEFGTGMEYIADAELHPLADSYGARRGEWGKGYGANPPWIYWDGPGSHAPNTTVPLPKGVGTLTYGFPANRTMYNTGKELHERLKEIVKDVFND